MYEKSKDKIELIFIGIYFFEQILLIFLYSFQIGSLTFWIGLFPVIFLTTIAIEKVFIKKTYNKEIGELNKTLKNLKGYTPEEEAGLKSLENKFRLIRRK